MKLKMKTKSPVRKNIRLKYYDYSQNGYYFITICAKNKHNIFGKFVGAGSKPACVELNEYGKIVNNTWFDLCNHNKNLELGNFIIMPNHIHGILIIQRSGLEPDPTKSISEIVRQFKTFSAKKINILRNTKGQSVWQRNYYEHIVRNEHGFMEINEYIENNPQKWELDKYYNNI